jgi:hypothetical protein
MATWFAQADANINAANMWSSLPAGGGTVLTWPPATDDILIANNKSVRLNVSVTVAECRNGTTGGATAGGEFRFLSVSGISLVANCYNDGSAIGFGIVRNSLASGTVYVVGNIYAGPGSTQYGIVFGGGATVNVTGKIFAGAGVNGWGASMSATQGPVNITGDIFGGSGTDARGITNATASTMTHTGNALAGSGSGSVAVWNNVAGSFTVSGYAEASADNAAINNVAQGIVTVGETRSASNGRPAVAGAFRYASATAAKFQPIIAGTQKTLAVLDVAALVPYAGDVRATVVYGDGAYTGTLPVNRKRLSMAGRF